MKAQPGDWLMIEGTHLNDKKRHGLIVEVHGVDGAPPYLVQWDDTGTESLFFPSTGAHLLTAEQVTQLHASSDAGAHPR